MKPGKSFKPFKEFIGQDRIGVAVDLGSWRGDFAIFLSEFSDMVVAVEPEINNFTNISDRIKDMANIRLLPFAISDTVGTAPMIKMGKSWQHSLFRKKGVTNVDKTMVPTITWDEMVKMLGIESVDFVKVNIEGAEESLIRGMNTVFPKKMVVEQHVRQMVCDPDNLRKLLEERGYEIVKYVDYDDWYVERK